MSNVKYVVIGGGRNDSASSLRVTDVANTIANAVSKFPGAEIWVFPMLWDNTWPTFAEMRKLGAIQGGCLGKDCHVVPNCITWGMFNGTWMTDIHPNTTGSSYYGRYIASAIMGGPDSAQRDLTIVDVSTPGTSGGEFYPQITGLQMLFYLRLNKTAWDRNAFAQSTGQQRGALGFRSLGQWMTARPCRFILMAKTSPSGILSVPVRAAPDGLP